MALADRTDLDVAAILGADASLPTAVMKAAGVGAAAVLGLLLTRSELSDAIRGSAPAPNLAGHTISADVLVTPPSHTAGHGLSAERLETEIARSPPHLRLARLASDARAEAILAQRERRVAFHLVRREARHRRSERIHHLSRASRPVRTHRVARLRRLRPASAPRP